MPSPASGRFIRKNVFIRMFGSFILRQPVQEIEVTDSALRLKIKGAWQTAAWGEISEAQLYAESHLVGGYRPHVQKAEHLSFRWKDTVWTIDVSPGWFSHFSESEKLRALLIQKLQPARTTMNMHQKLGLIGLLAVMGAGIVFLFIYFA